MDHLYRFSTSPEHPEVPCLTRTPYPFTTDFEAWYSYPVEHGWSDWKDPKRFTRDRHAWLAFMQTWCFFGPLNYVLRAPIAIADYTEATSGSNSRLCTKNLYTVLDAASKSILKDKTNGDYRDSLLRMMKKLDWQLQLNCFVIDSEHVSALVYLNLRIMASTLRTIATIWYYARFDQPDRDQPRPWMTTLAMNPIIRARFEKSGWCTGSIDRVLTQIPVEDQYFFSGLRRRVGHLSHESCNEMGCVAAQVDRTNYEIKHLEVQCTCEVVTNTLTLNIPDELISITSTVCDVIGDGDEFPVFTFSDALHLTSLDPARESVLTFIAFSHVWADGRGNPNSHGMPCCQLRHLQFLANGLCPLQGQPTPFWIDTLCIPVGPPNMKRRAISQIATVFSSASGVCVLDADLLAVPETESYHEVLARIQFSSWKSRLWTYQEAFVARDLVFAVGNKGLSLRAIRNQSEGLSTISCALAGIYNNTRLGGETFRVLQEANQQRLKDEWGSPLSVLYNEIRNCATSHPEDEPICAALLLGQNINPLLEIEENAEARMALFYQGLGRIPWTIVFAQGPKMRVEGFSWAPRTLLDMKCIDFRPPMSPDDGAVLTPHGIMNRATVYLFVDLYEMRYKKRITMIDCCTNEVFLVGNSSDPKAVTTSDRGFDFRNPFTTCLVVRDDPDVQTNLKNGAFLSIRSDKVFDPQTNELFCRYKCHVLIQPVSRVDPSEIQGKSTSTLKEQGYFDPAPQHYSVRTNLNVYIA